MNRPIKFRVWNKEEKFWVADGLEMDLYYSAKVGCFMFDNDSYDLARENVEFVQFTGLLDKNGKEIYEGDLITNIWQDSESIFEVKWNLYGFRLQSVTERFEMSKGEWRDCPTHIELSEVIGNIYENPELITQ
jgi:uncharacterized phage protein (TIGR01671 family)